MIAFLSGLLHTIFGFLTSFLPDSPFQDMYEATEAMSMGLGWLNWAFPVNECLGVFLAWLALMVIVVGARIIYLKAYNAVNKNLNDNGGYIGS